MANFLNTPDTTAQFDPEDIELNNRLSLLSYLGILVLIPIFLVKKSRFAKYHANQGLLLIIANVCVNLAVFLLKLIASALVSGLGWLLLKMGNAGAALTVSTVLGAVVSVIFGLLSFAVTVAVIALLVLGIVNAVKGKAKELPLIGRFRLLRGF
ncbi:MAG: zinc ribbon domain-containing protein [Candidatus Spyradocola sp.]